jgi:hypothetical protein
MAAFVEYKLDESNKNLTPDQKKIIETIKKKAKKILKQDC